MERNMFTDEQLEILRKGFQEHDFSGHCHVQVDIYFTGVGMVDLPTEQEMLALMDEIRIAKSNEIPA